MPAADARADELMRPGDVAAMFKVTPRVVIYWADSGKLHAIRTAGGHRRYRESEVRALFARLNPEADAA